MPYAVFEAQSVKKASKVKGEQGTKYSSVLMGPPLKQRGRERSVAADLGLDKSESRVEDN